MERKPVFNYALCFIYLFILSCTLENFSVPLHKQFSEKSDNWKKVMRIFVRLTIPAFTSWI